jgi:hypothetical protein
MPGTSLAPLPCVSIPLLSVTYLPVPILLFPSYPIAGLLRFGLAWQRTRSLAAVQLTSLDSKFWFVNIWSRIFFKSHNSSELGRVWFFYSFVFLFCHLYYYYYYYYIYLLFILVLFSFCAPCILHYPFWSTLASEVAALPVCFVCICPWGVAVLNSSVNKRSFLWNIHQTY